MDYQCFFKIYSKNSCISDLKYDPSGNSKLSFHVRADVSNLSLSYELLMFFYV